MPRDNETTTKFKVDISELKKAMQEAKQSVAVANSEFKAVASSMDDWRKSSEGLEAKLKQLNSNLSSQETILDSLEKQYKATVEEMGEGSKAANDFLIKVNNQKSVVNSVKKEIQKYNGELSDLKGETALVETSTDKASDAIKDMGKEAKNAEGGFTILKGAIADFASNAVSTLIGGIKDAIGSFVGLADETREYRTEMGKLDTAFTTAGFSAEAATDTYKDLYAILGDEGQTVEAANMLAKLVDTEEELAEWTNIAAGVYGTFGNSLPIEGLAEAANETAKTGALTGSLADALNWAGVNEEDFQASLDGCTTEQERQALITETLTSLYSDAAAAYKENNKSVMDANRANSDYTDTLATMGEKIEPVITTVKEGFNGLLQEVLKLVEGVDMTAFSVMIQEAFEVLTNTVLPAVKEGLGWIIEHKDILLAALQGIAAGFAVFKVAGIITSVINTLKNLSTVLGIVKGAVTALGGPIPLIISLIVAGFVFLWNNCESFREFWINLWENIKEFCGNAVTAIGKFFTETLPEAIDKMVAFLSELPRKVKDWLTKTLTNIKTWGTNAANSAKDTGRKIVDNVVNFVKGLPAKAKDWLTKTLTNIKTWGTNSISSAKDTGKRFIDNVISHVKELPSKIADWLSSALREVSSWGSGLAKKGKEAAKGLFDNIVNTIKELPSKLLDIGSDIVEGLWNGISNMSGWISRKIRGFGDNVLSGIKDFFGINSPSKVMADEVGKWIPEGIAVGIEKNAKSALNSMRDLTMNSVGAARNGLAGNVNTAGSSVVNNFYQTNNSPKALSRLEIYRQSKNLLSYTGGA